MFDDVVVVYKFLGDLMFYVTGDQDENEVGRGARAMAWPARGWQRLAEVEALLMVRGGPWAALGVDASSFCKPLRGKICRKVLQPCSVLPAMPR